jgi:hypothetical protein
MPYLIALIGRPLSCWAAVRGESTAQRSTKAIATATLPAQRKKPRLNRSAWKPNGRRTRSAKRAESSPTAQPRKWQPCVREMAANTERTTRELRARASATRQCFSGSVAGLLNSATPIRESVSRDPASAAAPGTAPLAAGPAASADGPGTSELAAAGALRLARDSFSACKAQLRAVLVATDNVPIESWPPSLLTTGTSPPKLAGCCTSGHMPC